MRLANREGCELLDEYTSPAVKAAVSAWRAQAQDSSADKHDALNARPTNPCWPLLEANAGLGSVEETSTKRKLQLAGAARN